MEEEIDEIVEARVKELTGWVVQDKRTLKLAVIDGYRAGMEASRKIFHG